MSNIAWSPRDAAFGAVISAAAAVVIATGHVENGLYLLIGALPAAILGLPPLRKDRRRVLVIGIIFGVSIVLGSILAQWVAVAIVGMFVLGLGAALLTNRKPLGFVVMTIALPLVGIGLTYVGLEHSARLGLLFIGGSAIALVVSLCFPEYTAPAEVRPALLPIAEARDYGVRLGLAAALATAIGFHYGAEHVGWIVGSTLLVMRPGKEMLALRGVGRAVSVFAGGLVAAWLLSLDLSPVTIAVVGAGAIVATAATHASRWYVTPAFTTFLILWCLLYGQASDANIQHRFAERVFDTLVGIGIAYLFGFLVPRLRHRRNTELPRATTTT